MSDTRCILVPVDFSSHSDAALERAFDVAAIEDSTVHLLHAITFPPATFEPAFPTSARDEMRRSARADFSQLEDRLARGDRRFTSALVEGDPATEIQKAARSHGAHMIVMGSHGRRGFDRLLLGSVAERMLAWSPVPIQIVRGSPDEAAHPIRSILFATDFSEDAECAEAIIARWAASLSAEVEVFHAIHQATSLFAPYAVDGGHDFEDELMESATRRIERVATRFGERGVATKTTVALGRAPEAILERAESIGAQLIAMGRRGYSTFQRFLLGSVTQRVTRYAPCDVLVASTRMERDPR